MHAYAQIGAVTNTFGVPGVDENCFYMKSAEDAKALRERINACFELANLPDTTDEERKRLLSFVIVSTQCTPLLESRGVYSFYFAVTCADT